VRYENSVIASLGAFDAVLETNNCTFRNTLLSRQMVPPSGTMVADPAFVDPSARDFHLQAASLAIDAAVASMFALDSTIDLDGTTRPQGVKNDLGAYEHKP
jgi:hypothetical protein